MMMMMIAKSNAMRKSDREKEAELKAVDPTATQQAVAAQQ